MSNSDLAVHLSALIAYVRRQNAFMPPEDQATLRAAEMALAGAERRERETCGGGAAGASCTNVRCDQGNDG